MKAKLLFSIIWVICPLFNIALAQSSKSAIDLQKEFSNYNCTASVSHQNYFDQMANPMGISEGTEMKVLRAINGSDKNVHYKFQQYYKDLPVIGNIYILHENNGKVNYANGLYTPYLNVNTEPSISEKNALQKATIYMGGIHTDNKEKWRTQSIIKNISPPVLCIIDQSYPDNSGQMRLTYQIDMESTEPLKKMRYFVDAHNGEMIKSLSLIQEHGVPSKGHTKYYGVQNMITDSIAPDKFLLQDITRGGGIRILGPDDKVFTNNTNTWDLTNAKKDEVSLDALYCTQNFYDLLFERFNWTGLDGLGKAMDVKVHNNGAGPVNAFWDGEYANFGDGDCTYGPLTTHEVLGHEFTHGLIEFTSGLIYEGESGAINESIADMFGQALEYYSDQSRFSWVLGHSFILEPSAVPFRIMDDPKQLQMPAFYNGEFWQDGSDVHVNSSIGNLWFVILSDGRTGINEGGQNFDVAGIGIEKAHRIIFLANNSYNIPTTDYSQLTQNTLKAAEELYGLDSPEWLAVKEAWKAVGLSGAPGGVANDLAINTSIDFFSTCETEEFLPFTIKISNRGSKDYDPADNARIILNNGTLGTLTIGLDEVIISGETKIIELNDWIKYSGSDFENYDFELVYDDENLNNNYRNLFIEFKQNPANDLAVFAYSETESACGNSLVEVELVYYNNGCLPIPAGNIIEFKLRDANNSVVWSKTKILDEDLGTEIYLTETFDLQLNFEGEEQFSMEGELTGDPFTLNNQSFLEFKALEQIKSTYHQDFNNIPLNLDQLILETSMPIISIEYNNESYLGFTGFDTDTFSRQRCLSPEELINTTEELNGQLIACVDLSSVETSSLEFELVLFKNQFFEQDHYPYSSIVEVSWKGTEDGSMLIYDQQEGIRKHYGIDLPKFFEGQISFRFFAESGNFFIDPSSFENDDVILMDDLRINKGTSRTKEIEHNNITVFPNPANGILNISNPGTIKNERIFLTDIMGRTLEKLDGNTTAINISNLEAGVYFLKITGNNFQSQSIKFIKL